MRNEPPFDALEFFPFAILSSGVHREMPLPLDFYLAFAVFAVAMTAGAVVAGRRRSLERAVTRGDFIALARFARAGAKRRRSANDPLRSVLRELLEPFPSASLVELGAHASRAEEPDAELVFSVVFAVLWKRKRQTERALRRHADWPALARSFGEGEGA